MKAIDYWHCFLGIQTREWLRFWQQRTRFASALVRPCSGWWYLPPGFGRFWAFPLFPLPDLHHL